MLVRLKILHLKPKSSQDIFSCVSFVFGRSENSIFFKDLLTIGLTNVPSIFGSVVIGKEAAVLS